MLKKLFCCSLLLFPVQGAFAEEGPQTQGLKGRNGDVNWESTATITIPARAIDFAHSLDNKKVFILTEDARVHVITAAGTELGVIPVASGVSAIEVAARGELLFLFNAQDNTFTALDISINQNLDISGAPTRGPQDAPVTLVAFSDFQCPFCIELTPVLEKIMHKYPDKVRLAFKHLPISRLHPQAEAAARAAIAAQKQNKFWEMHDAFFALTDEQWEQNGIIEDTAKQAGLDMTRFSADWDSEETRMALAKDVMDAQNADITGTPALFVNGTPALDRSINSVEKMVKEILEGPALQAPVKAAPHNDKP